MLWHRGWTVQGITPSGFTHVTASWVINFLEAKSSCEVRRLESINVAVFGHWCVTGSEKSGVAWQDWGFRFLEDGFRSLSIELRQAAAVSGWGGGEGEFTEDHSRNAGSCSRVYSWTSWWWDTRLVLYKLWIRLSGLQYKLWEFQNQ